MNRTTERRVKTLEDQAPRKKRLCLLMVEGDPIPANWDYENGMVLCADDGISEGRGDEQP